MINPDLTEIFERYSEWDYVVRNKYLRYVTTILSQHEVVTCRGIQYRHIKDLKVDLEADCYPFDHDDETQNLNLARD